MRARLLVACLLLASLLLGQAGALAHDIGHLHDQAPLPAECAEHYFASQMGGGPVPLPPAVAMVAGSPPAPALIRERDASIPARHAYFAQAPPPLLH